MISILPSLRAMSLVRTEELVADPRTIQPPMSEADRRRLEVFCIGSLDYFHVFPKNADTEAARKRLDCTTEVAGDFRNYLIRRAYK